MTSARLFQIIYNFHNLIFYPLSMTFHHKIFPCFSMTVGTLLTVLSMSLLVAPYLSAITSATAFAPRNSVFQLWELQYTTITTPIADSTLLDTDLDVFNFERIIVSIKIKVQTPFDVLISSTWIELSVRR